MIPAELLFTINDFSPLDCELGITILELNSDVTPAEIGIRTCNLSDVPAPILYPSKTFSGLTDGFV